MIKFDREFGYDDFYMKPQKSVAPTRGSCDPSVQLGKFKFDLPVYPANMLSVVDVETCLFMAKNNCFYTMHRFGVDLVKFCLYMQKHKAYTSISVGINKNSYNQLRSLKKYNLNPDFITIDVANAWSDKTFRMIDFIKENFPNAFLIVGNVATYDAVEDLHNRGAGAIKSGIGGGKSCITRNKTGFYRPMGSCIAECCQNQDILVIADGGVREHGHIAKAIVLGAHMVMAGSLFAGYDQSSGKIIEIDGKKYKEYFGNASEFAKGEYKNVEGKKIYEPYKSDMTRLLKELKEDIQSAISYSGGLKLKDLYNCPIYFTDR